MRVALIAAACCATLPAFADGAADDEAPSFAVSGPAGFGISSPDGASILITHWLVQSDLRAFVGDSPAPDRDTFLLRFAGVRVDAQLARSFGAGLFANFADNRVALLEGWVEARAGDAVRLRAGKFPFPITAERLTPATALPFVSASVPAMLLPARDTGVQLLGAVGGVVHYNLALLNGASAGGAGDADADSAKDVVARIFVRPFARAGLAPLAQLGVGVGASAGEHEGTPDNPRLPSLATYGGQTFFSYARGAHADGRVLRVAPHLTYGWGPFAIYADAVFTRERVSGRDVAARAVGAVASVVVTGEDAAPLAFVVPRRPFDLAAGHVGAVALVAGVGEVRVGREAFPELADPATAMRAMRVVGAGVNWSIVRGVALVVSYGHQVFTAAPGGTARDAEDTVIARLQVVL